MKSQHFFIAIAANGYIKTPTKTKKLLFILGDK